MCGSKGKVPIAKASDKLIFTKTLVVDLNSGKCRGEDGLWIMAGVGGAGNCATNLYSRAMVMI